MAPRLAVTVTHAGGLTTRWGADEANPLFVPSGISFGTTIPGGFKDASLTLPRRIDRAYPDLNLYDDIRIYAPGGQRAWEGRVAQLPMQHDASTSVNVGAIGWSAHLQDDPSFSMIYVDRDLSHWGEMSAPRRASLAGAGWTFGDFAVAPDITTGSPAIVTKITGAWSGPPIIDAVYDAGSGNRIGKLHYEFVAGPGIDTTSLYWFWLVGVASDDTGITSETTANLKASSGDGTFSPTNAYRFGYLEHYFSIAPGGGDNSVYDVTWTKIAVYGDHGLSLYGSAPGQLYGSDVIAHILDRAAPLLQYTTTGDDATISATTFEIPHLVFREPTTADAAISTVNGYHLFDWAVWEDRTFYWREPDPERLTWQARRSDGARVALEGDDASNIFSGVVVQYTDAAGVARTVGPSSSGQENTAASLVDNSETNPINAHRLPRRWGILSISSPTTLAAATQLGAIWLAEHSQPQRRGTITITGSATHPTKGTRPVMEIRAGDWITIADRPGDTPRKIIETSYTHDQQSIQCSVGNTTFKLDAILERLGVNLVGVI